MGGKQTQSQRLVICRFFLFSHKCTTNTEQTSTQKSTRTPCNQPLWDHIDDHNTSTKSSTKTQSFNARDQHPQSIVPAQCEPIHRTTIIKSTIHFIRVHHRNKQCKTNSNIETPTIHGPMIPWFHDFISCCAKAPPRHWMPSNIIECHRISLNIIKHHWISLNVIKYANSHNTQTSH